MMTLRRITLALIWLSITMSPLVLTFSPSLWTVTWVIGLFVVQQVCAGLFIFWIPQYDKDWRNIFRKYEDMK